MAAVLRKKCTATAALTSSSLNVNWNGIMRCNQQKIHDCLCHKGLQWHQSSFVSFERGAWEALIKSAKKILQLLLRERILDEESLHTFMVKVEWILNNRPLTTVSDSPDNLAALTPMALLSGCITPTTATWCIQLNGLVRRVMVRTTHGRFLRDVGKLCLLKANN